MRHLAVTVVCTFLLGNLVGCAEEQNATVLTALRTEQSLNGVVIARKNYQQLEMIAVTQTMNAERVIVPMAAAIGDEAATQDKTGEWISSCESQLCTISNRKTGVKQTFNAGNMITSLQWSPDGKLLFFVRQVKGFRLPVRCSLEDERDLIVYDPGIQLETRVITLCGGYPYSSLHWYMIAH
jgi:hypothetical protein